MPELGVIRTSEQNTNIQKEKCFPEGRESAFTVTKYCPQIYSD